MIGQQTSKLVLPPKHVDGRIPVGGQTIIGAVTPDGKNDYDSDMNDDDDDEVHTIGDSSSDEDSR